MPQFAPGESKAAIAPITVKPAGLSCEAEIFLGPDEMTKVATSGRIAFTSTGASQDVRLPIAMPEAEGTYHVYVDVYAEGYRVAAYQAIEDVVIKAVPAVGDFVYSNQVCGMRTYAPAPSWTQATYSCRITNHGSRGTRKVTFHYTYFHTYAGQMYVDYSKSFELTLEPGQSYTFTWWSGIDYNSVFGSCARITMWLEDDAGGGTTPCVQETPYW